MNGSIVILDNLPIHDCWDTLNLDMDEKITIVNSIVKQVALDTYSAKEEEQFLSTEDQKYLISTLIKIFFS